MTTLTLISLDHLNRQALVAVELIDPVTLLTVTRGISITAEGLTGLPVMTWSGRFAWYTEGEDWPARFFIEPGAQPYDRQIVDAPARPPQPSQPKPGEVRLARVTLRPTAAYPFTDGITVARGMLREGSAPDAAPVEGAEVWIRWLKAPTSGRTAQWVDASARARTNSAGEFAAILRLPVPAWPEREMSTGPLMARIAVSRNGQACEQANEVTEWKIYRLPEGHLYNLPEALAWSALSPV